MASEPPILSYAKPEPDRLLRWIVRLLLADLALVVAGVVTGIGGDVYDRLHPMSWRGAAVTGPIYNALFLAAGVLWLPIVLLAGAAIVRHRRRAGRKYWWLSPSFSSRCTKL